MNQFIISDVKKGERIRVFTAESEESYWDGEYQGTDLAFIKIKNERSETWYISISHIVAFRIL